MKIQLEKENKGRNLQKNFSSARHVTLGRHVTKHRNSQKN